MHRNVYQSLILAKSMQAYFEARRQHMKQMAALDALRHSGSVHAHLRPALHAPPRLPYGIPETAYEEEKGRFGRDWQATSYFGRERGAALTLRQLHGLKTYIVQVSGQYGYRAHLYERATIADNLRRAEQNNSHAYQNLIDKARRRGSD